jgi:transmembrane sensor
LSDKNLHSDKMNPDNYPEPDIPADEAWTEMNQLLDADSGPAPQRKTGNLFRGNLFLYAGAGLLLVMVAAYLLLSQKPVKQLPAKTLYSQEKPVKDSLPDGTIVFMDSYSTVNEFAGSNKEKLITINGAAYFQNMMHNNEVSYRLRIGSIDVLPENASVYLSFDSALSVSSVTVNSGTAGLEIGGEKLFLAAGQTLQYDEKRKQIKSKQQADVNSFSFATKIFEFNDTPLEQAAKTIAKAYGVTIVIENKKLYNCRITTRFDNKTIEEVLNIMANTLDFNYELDVKKNKVLINGDGCE